VADRVTLSELIAYRPLVFAWVWETLCVAGAVYFGAVHDNFGAMLGLVLGGAIPFVVVLVMFLQARKRGELGPKPKSIVE
jgi:hypothetical protein